MRDACKRIILSSINICTPYYNIYNITYKQHALVGLGRPDFVKRYDRHYTYFARVSTQQLTDCTQYRRCRIGKYKLYTHTHIHITHTGSGTPRYNIILYYILASALAVTNTNDIFPYILTPLKEPRAHKPFGSGGGRSL